MSVAHVVNNQVISTTQLGVLAPQIKWQFIGIGDFNGDGVADVLWRDAADQGGTGHLLDWIISGGGTQVDAHGEEANIGTPTLTANVAGIGDFNGDGRSDILFNDQGTLSTWEMNGTTITGGGTIGAVPGGDFVKGVGDFNGDGSSDILFQNADGSYSTWDINGSKVVGGGSLGTPGAGWTFASIGDVNNDGHSDILFKNASGGHLIWELNDTQVTGAVIGEGPIDAGKFGDFDADGNADVLWRFTDGSVATWKMSNGNAEAAHFIGGVSSDWHIAGMGDFNADDHSDVLWVNDNGSVLVWEMTDTATIGATPGLGTRPDGTTLAGIGDFNGTVSATCCGATPPPETSPCG